MAEIRASSMKEAIAKKILENLVTQQDSGVQLVTYLTTFSHVGFSADQVREAVDELLKRKLVTLTVESGGAWSPRLRIAEGKNVASYDERRTAYR